MVAPNYSFAKDMQMWIGGEVTTDYEPTCFLLRFAAQFQWMWNQLATQGSPLTPARFKSAWESRVDAKLVSSWGASVSGELKGGLLPLLLDEIAALLRQKKRDHLTSIVDLYEVLIGDKFKKWLKTYAQSLSPKDPFKLSRRDHNVSTLCHVVRCMFTALRDRIMATVPADELSLTTALRMRDLPRAILDSPTTGVFGGLQLHIDPPTAALGSRLAKTENVVREVVLQGRLAVLQNRADGYVKQLVAEWGIKEGGGRKGPAGPVCRECEGELDLTASFASVRCKEASLCRTALHEYCLLSGVGGSLDPNEPLCPKCGGAVDQVWLKCGSKLVENQYNSGASLSALEVKALEGTEEEAADEGADVAEEEEEDSDSDEERKHASDVIPRAVKVSRNLHARIAAGGAGDLHPGAKSRSAYKLEQAAVRDAKKIDETQKAALRKERLAADEARRKEKEAAEAAEAALAAKKPRSAAAGGGIAVVNKGDVAKIARKKDGLTPLMAVQAELASNREGGASDEDSHSNCGSEDGFHTVRKAAPSSTKSSSSSSSKSFASDADWEERRLARQRAEVSLLRGSSSSSKAPVTGSIPLPSAWSAPSPSARDGVQIHVPTAAAAPLASSLGWGAAREAAPVAETSSSAFPPLAASSGSKSAQLSSSSTSSGSYVQPYQSAAAAKAAAKAAAREEQEKQEALDRVAAMEREEAFKAAKAAAKKKRLAEQAAAQQAEQLRLAEEERIAAEEEKQARELKKRQKVAAAAAKQLEIEEAQAAAAAATAEAAAASALAVVSVASSPAPSPVKAKAAAAVSSTPLKPAVLHPSFAEHKEPSAAFDPPSYSSSSSSSRALSPLEEKKRLDFIEAQVEGEGEPDPEPEMVAAMAAAAMAGARAHTPLNAAVGPVGPVGIAASSVSIQHPTPSHYHALSVSASSPGMAAANHAHAQPGASVSPFYSLFATPSLPATPAPVAAPSLVLLPLAPALLPSSVVQTSTLALSGSAARDVQLVESVRTFAPNAGESLTLLVTGLNECRHLVTGHLIGSLCMTFGSVKVRQVLSMHPSQGFCIIVMFDRLESARAAYRSLHRMVVELDAGPASKPKECTLSLAFVAPTNTGAVDVRVAPTITARLKGQRPAESVAHSQLSHSPIQPPGGMAHFV